MLLKIRANAPQKKATGEQCSREAAPGCRAPVISQQRYFLLLRQTKFQQGGGGGIKAALKEN